VSATETPNTESAAPETPPPATPERSCPRCGAALREDQEWCLQCGTGVGAHVAAPRGWRVPMAIVGGLLALIIVAAILAIVELAGGPEQVTTATSAPTAAPTAVPTAAPPSLPTPTPTLTPAPTTTTAPGGAAAVGDWPAGKTGFTVVLESDSTRSAAEARARDLAGQGMSVGLLDTSGYKPFAPNRFVVFSGQFVTRAEARKALGAIRSRVAGARVARVAPA
jgi:septal ring-binding cell division protein DamX